MSGFGPPAVLCRPVACGWPADARTQLRPNPNLKAQIGYPNNVFTYSAICDVPEETLRCVTALLHAQRREIGTRVGRRAGTVRAQARLVLRWFRDDAPVRLLAVEAGLAISICYRYLHEAIDVIAEQAPDLHDVLEQAKRDGWSHVTLDATLVEIDRLNERTQVGHHRWYSGKHKTQGGNVPDTGRPRGVLVWSSEVTPGSTHDITAARMHCLGALVSNCSVSAASIA